AAYKARYTKCAGTDGTRGTMSLVSHLSLPSLKRLRNLVRISLRSRQKVVNRASDCLRGGHRILDAAARVTERSLTFRLPVLTDDFRLVRNVVGRESVAKLAA